MYEVTADRHDNRLLLDLEGRMGAETLDEAAEETLEAAEGLREGFDIVNDLTGFRPPSPEAAQAIKRAQGELVEMGVDRVVRVVDDETSEVVVNAFERRSRDVGYSGEVASSLSEAERRLEEEAVEGFQSRDG
jgi:threonine dehydrogenase-like Zn-dependent dehydrogenase